jgi:peptide/nickel transport system substrate-binding protein
MLKHATKADPWSHVWGNLNCAGFGPYQISNFVPGTSISYSANPHYYRGQPQYTTVTVKAIPEDANRIAAVEAGEADIAEFLAPVELQAMAKNSNISVLGKYTNQIDVLLLNYAYKPWNLPNNKLIRQAVAYALPYDDIVTEDYSGFGRRMYSLIPQSFSGYEANYTYNTNLSKAKSLLAQAGFPGGKGLEQYSSAFELCYVTERSSLLEPIANRIQTSLAQIGINITLSPITDADFATRQFVKKDMPMAIVDAGNPIIPDAIYVCRVFYQTPSKGGLVDAQNYSNPTFDKLVAQATGATGAQRTAFAHQLQTILMEDLPAIPMVELLPAIAVRKPLTGFLISEDNDVPSYWYFKS